VNDHGTLAVSSSRPPAFIIGNWQAAFHKSKVVGPQPVNADSADKSFRCEVLHYFRARLADRAGRKPVKAVMSFFQFYRQRFRLSGKNHDNT